MRHPRLALVAAVALAALGCASSRSGAQQPPVTTARDSLLASSDTAAASTQIPAGFGSLRQDDVAIKLQIGGKQVKILPLDEGVIRTLSPDSYRALRNLEDSKLPQITELARRNGVTGYSLWYVQYYGLEPEARFSPRDLTIGSGGREYRPVDILPLSAGFGQERLRQREVQQAIYLFDNTVDVGQPLTFTVEGTPNSSWLDTLRRVDRERALIRSRASKSGA